MSWEGPRASWEGWSQLGGPGATWEGQLRGPDGVESWQKKKPVAKIHKMVSGSHDLLYCFFLF